MGTVFRKLTTRAVPAGAEITEKGGKRVARWKSRGKARVAPITKGEDGTDRVMTESKTYYAKFRDHTGAVVVRPTACRDEANARQQLAAWEREVEQIKVGTLDAKELDAVQRAAGPLGDHLAAYERSLVASEASDTHRKNVLAAVRRVAADCGFKTLADIAREPVENWLADRIDGEDAMGARSRNRYRESLVAFLNWCQKSKKLPKGHDLALLPKANTDADPRWQRRALNEDELGRLLAVAAIRPLTEARMVRRGKDKGKPETVERLTRLGQERALIYKTLAQTGLRKGELAALTVAHLNLEPGVEHVQLEAADEKNRKGNGIPLRAGLAADLRAWLGEKLDLAQAEARDAGGPIPMRLPAETPLFDVPTGLVRILNRDLKTAGIPKRDDRGRTIDVHAMRTTFGTFLSTTGTMPRIAQAAMRHSDIKLTMGVYTDPRMLDVRTTVEKMPALPLPSVGSETVQVRATGTNGPVSVAPTVAPTAGNREHPEATLGTMGSSNGSENGSGGDAKIARNGNEKPSVASSVTEGHRVGLTGD